MDKFKIYFLYTLLIIGVLISTYFSFLKAKVELQNKNIELVMDFDDVIKLSLREGLSVNTLLQKLKSAGITTIAISENTLETLQQKGLVIWLTGYETNILNKLGKSKTTNSNFKKTLKSKKAEKSTIVTKVISNQKSNDLYSYVIADEPMIDFVKLQLQNYLGKNRVKTIDRNKILVIDDNEDLLTLGLGITTHEVEILNKYGFYLIPRIKNNYRLDGSILTQKISSTLKIANFDKILFEGEEVGGYKSNIESVAKSLVDNKINYCYIELAEQKGDKILLTLMNDNVIRTHSIPQEEMQEKMTLKEAISRFERAFLERGVKVLFIRPFYIPYSGNNLIENNLEYIKAISEKIKLRGFVLGKSNKINVDETLINNPYLFLLLALAIGSALCLLIMLLSNNKNLKISLILFLFVFISLLFIISKQTIFLRKFLALLSAIVFPLNAVLIPIKLNDECYPSTISRAIFSVLLSFFIALVGGLFISALLFETKFLTGASQFVGVKIAFVLPILFLLYYLVKLIYPSKKLSDFFVINVNLGMILLLLIVAFTIFVYISRSGNFGIGILDFERIFRAILEKILIVRPRTKEFLIGYPFLFLAFMLIANSKKVNLSMFLFLIGIIGPISTINTFCHAHSPVVISLIRSFYGVILGISVGIIYYVATLLIFKKNSKIWKF